jgi:osmotically inducible lipoprotein OsmB
MLRAMSVITAIGLLTVALGGCGTTATERGVTGGAIGAGAGAAGAAVTGGSPAGGALLGGAAGAATGVLTDEEDVDLGDPVWQ